MDWQLAIGLVAAVCSAGGVGSMLGHLLTRRTAREQNALTAEELQIKAQHVVVEQEQAETARMAQVIQGWENLLAPYKAELGELRDRVTVAEQQHGECQALVAALSRLVREEQQRGGVAGGRRVGDRGL